MKATFLKPFSGFIFGYKYNLARIDSYHRVEVTLAIEPNTRIIEQHSGYITGEESIEQTLRTFVVYTGHDEAVAQKAILFLQAALKERRVIHSTEIEVLRKGGSD